MNRPLLRALAALIAAAIASIAPVAARASQNQESIFQDDDHLIYGSTGTVNHTLDVLQSLGVDRVRITIKWSLIAPNATSRTRPRNLDASNPAAYPASNWAPYDRIVQLALAHGIGLDFNVTAPGPLWAMRHDAPSSVLADHFAPSVSEFEQFVRALGTRYSGSYAPPAPPAGKAGGSLLGGVPLPVTVPGVTTTSPTEPSSGPTAGDPGAIPRVHFWTIWNEPNIQGWLMPQWRRVSGQLVENSPRLYRQYVDAGLGALLATGHSPSKDTVLIGELAPEGYDTATGYQELTPMRFLRALYCVDGSFTPLGGSRASALGCPSGESARAFVNKHPGLFFATGFAHHPYYFFFPPTFSSPNPNFVPMANLGRLERGLDRIFSAYGVHRQLPLYLTEYGYKTYPPDPKFKGIVSPDQQAAYINEADNIAWRDRRVRSVSQFLLYDALPDSRYPKSSPNYWATFQTGLLFAPSGAKKPAYAAYRLPIVVPTPRIAHGGLLFVWGQLRAAPDNTTQTARIQWRRRGGSFKTIATVTTSNPEGYLTTLVRLPGSGAIRLAWGSQVSRVVNVVVG
jgi:hypothetical protein